MKTPFGSNELDEYRIDVPAVNQRSRHPHDAKAEMDFPEFWGKSSAGNHMLIHTGVWKNADGTTMGRGTQWGAQFDAPNHYKEGGATSVDKSKVNGKAIVVDLRAELAELSDGKKITADVVSKALERILGRADISTLSKYFGRVLLRTLDDSQAASEVSMNSFPYFENQAAVFALLDGIKEATGTTVEVVFNEPPSVDEANEGHLAHEDPEDHSGGAHGAFDSRNVIIGENWDFRNFEHGQSGVTMVFFDPNLAGSPDSDLVSGAYFVPSEKIEDVKRVMFSE